MNDGGFLYIPFLYNIVFNLLIVIYRLVGENLGLSLILVAVLSRVITLPLTARQIKNAEKAKDFQKKYEETKDKFKNNKEKQAQELTKLQGEYLPGQIAGCLPLIVQLLMLIQINHVIRNLLKNGALAFNEVAYGFVDKFDPSYQFNLNFLGQVNLGQSANDVGATNFSESWPYLLIALFLVVTQYFSMKMFTTLSPKKKEEKKAKDGKNDEVPSFGEVFQQTNSQMMFLFPLILGFFSLNYPSGLSLYFATTSLFVIIQQLIVKRKEVVAKIKERFFVTDEETKEEKKTETRKEFLEGEEKEQTPTHKKKKKKSKRKKKRK